MALTNSSSLSVEGQWICPLERPEIVVERLLEATDGKHHGEALRSRARSAVATGSEHTDPWDILGDTAERAGLRVTRVHAATRKILRTLAPGQPVVAMRSGREVGWVVISRAHGGRYVVDAGLASPPVIVGTGRLIAMLGASSAAEELDWLLVESATPLRNMKASRLVGEDGRKPGPIARLLALMETEKNDVGVVLIYAVAVGVLMLATPIAVQALVNSVAFGTLMQPLIVLSVLLFAVLGFAATLRALESWVVEIIQRRIFLRLVSDLSYRLPRVERSAFDKAYGPELVNRFFDVFTVKKVSAWLLLEGLEIVVTAVFGMILLAFYHPILLAFDIVIILLALFIVFVLGRGATNTTIKESKAKYAVASWLEEMARHHDAFKHAGGHDYARLRADDLAYQYIETRRRHFRVVFRQIVGALGMQAVASAGLLAVGGYLVIQRQLTLGQLVAAELVVATIVASIIKLGKYFEQVYDLFAAVDKLGNLVDLPLERRGGQLTPRTNCRRGADVKLSHLTFGYLTDHKLFKDAHAHIQAGEKVVVTGPNGSGKTALLELLFSLRCPNDGRIEFDGVDLHDIELQSLRRRIAMVRSPEIVEGTIYQNVQFGRDGVSIDDARRALDMFGLLDELGSLPDGLDTRVESGGARLSQSQRVRLALARAVVGQPCLLLVDDLLGSLDGRTRRRTLDVLTAADSGWTLLLVSSDPETVLRADRVLRVTEGRIDPLTPSAAAE